MTASRLTSALLLSAWLLVGCGAESAPPNLLLVTLDTTRADRFGYFGYENAKTPRFDAFVAERAVWFQNAITAVPVTFPSHTTIHTGTFPVSHGVHDNDGYYLDDDVTTLAEILKGEGFTTGAVLAAFPLDSEVNLDQGFDSYDDDYQADWSPAELAARGPFSFGFLERKADRVNVAVERWLERNGDDRFFLWVHYFDPHQPWNAPAPYDSQFSADPYDGEIAFLDENFGKLLDMFDQRGLLDNTVVSVVGDHGEAIGEHGEPTHASFIYDATMRVPMIFAAPGGRFDPGRSVDSQVRTVDVAPTLLELLDLPPGADMQGRSLVPLLEDPAVEWEEEALLESYYAKFHFGWSPLRALRANDFKYIEAPRQELYDLAEDPGELINLASSEPERVAELRDRLYRLARHWSSDDLARSVSAQVDDDTRQKLEALGYLSGGSTASERAAPFPSPEQLSEFDSPMDKTLILRHTNFIHEMLRAQRFDDAIPVIRRALELDPKNHKLYVQLGRSSAALLRFEPALEYLQKAQSLRPEDAEAYAIEGRIYTTRGEYEKAVAPLTKAVELYPQQVNTLEELAAVYLALGDTEKAISHFEAVLDLDDSRWTALADLANAYYQDDRLEDARAMFQRALELNPYSPVLHFQIGLFYRNLGNTDFSRQMFEAAVQIAPNHLPSNLGLGELLLGLGETEEARARLEHVVELSPNSNLGARARQLLDGAAVN